MSRRKSLRRPNVTVVPQPAVPIPKKEQSGWLQRGVIAGILFFMAVAVATLAFWYYAATTGLFALSDTDLYFIRNIGLIGLLIGGLGLFIAISAFRRALLPAADLLQAAEQVANGDYNIELQERGPRELRSLTRMFNYMVNRLRAHEETRRHLYAEVARVLLDSQDPRHSRLIHDWSRLALAENGEMLLHPEPSDLVALARDTLMTLHKEVSAHGATLRATLPNTPLIAELDPVSFSETLAALVIHALGRLNVNGGEIRVELSEVRRPPGVRVAVTDNGRAPTPAELDALSTTLRAAPSTGSGLEMPLARTLIEAQGGEISALNSGEWDLTVAFFLPFS
ncbi:MAG: HAMP domain-containing sensor histidine kinase [Anaerolineae bacterium]